MKGNVANHYLRSAVPQQVFKSFLNRNTDLGAVFKYNLTISALRSASLPSASWDSIQFPQTVSRVRNFSIY